LTEGCPNGALEAMALGLPVLGTNISGMRQAIGETASDSCLSPAGDWSDLASKIALRINNPELRIQEGSRNRNRIRDDFSLKNMSLQSLQSIKTALE
jgi:glycosyltransferase involved in cell wall biosynthesis